jgi:hypothetical protein
MRDYRAQRRPLVVACSALKAAYRQVLIGDLTEVVVVYLTAPRELISDRLQRRQGHFMSADLLETQIDTLEPPCAPLQSRSTRRSVRSWGRFSTHSPRSGHSVRRLLVHHWTPWGESAAGLIWCRRG